MRIKVKVIAGASQNLVIGWEGDVLKVKCTTAPEKGKANQAVIALIAEYYRVSKSRVRIIRGQTHAHKVIEIESFSLLEKPVD